MYLAGWNPFLFVQQICQQVILNWNKLQTLPLPAQQVIDPFLNQVVGNTDLRTELWHMCKTNSFCLSESHKVLRSLDLVVVECSGSYTSVAESAQREPLFNQYKRRTKTAYSEEKDHDNNQSIIAAFSSNKYL